MDIATLLASLAPLPETDFAEFGDVEVRKLSKMQRLTGQFLGRNWLTIPHVTHHDEVDVTAMEGRRTAWNIAHPDTKVTPVAMLVRALAMVLPDFPAFNASLSSDGQSLVFKTYVNIGVAVDTPNGLLVPVIRGVDALSLTDIVGRLKTLAQKARTKGLSMAEMSGSSMSLSSLGHIGGTAFTPIINAPDVAILGATALQERATRGEGDAVVWKTVLPLSLSYDHRVINGADAARFVQAVGRALADEAIFS